TRDEVTAFREVFQIAEQDEAQAARVFNLARQDVAGFDVYAGRIAEMFGPASETLCDIMDGLFHIAMADGGYHPAEDEFLAEVARIFGMGEARFRNLRARHVPDAMADPYAILGVDPGATYDEVRAAWKRLVRENHPDRLAARGLPQEAMSMAERRLIDINLAWDEINAKRPTDALVL
ncbi:MAG: DnaJ family molecular chaperone, partial [Pseudomonadota bacterium]|nr:DnaJ family molecular chaperone [Pseudomonadota bacterium]